MFPAGDKALPAPTVIGKPVAVTVNPAGAFKGEPVPGALEKLLKPPAPPAPP